jgi:hypothetical protein
VYYLRLRRVIPRIAGIGMKGRLVVVDERRIRVPGPIFEPANEVIV